MKTLNNKSMDTKFNNSRIKNSSVVNHEKKRKLIQLVAAICTNGNLKGFIKGSISKSKSKYICVPGMNCYSCPGALGSCPIGAMQAVIGSRKHNFSFYVFGMISLFGVILGRFICGWLCAFGLIQDLLYMIPTPKFKLPDKIDNALRYLKYIILLVFVFGLPMFLVDKYGMSPPYFCEYICPVGMFEGAVPIMLMNKSLRATIGFLFYFKSAILILIILMSVFIERPFCKYICPLGAIYGLFNKISFLKLKRNADFCTDCSACERACPMKVKVTTKCDSAECIRCGKCVSVCPEKALELTFK